MKVQLAVLLGSAVAVLGHQFPADGHARRQAPAVAAAPASTSSTSSSSTSTATHNRPTTTTVSNHSAVSPPAGATTSSATSTVPALETVSFSAPVVGSRPSNLPNAPPLPDYRTIVNTDYPTLDILPPTDSDQVKRWMAEIDWSQVPDIPPTAPGGCQNATANADAIAAAGADGNCWWTCGSCHRPDDIVMCPTKLTWGLSFDDGPSAYTPNLLQFLRQRNLFSTFFIVGSRALARPDVLQRTYLDGHEISTHTWAHSALTTLTNEGVVAELGWSREIIRRVTGVTPTTMRPPYGDIDDRVRSISRAMGMTPIIWTSAGGRSFDTQDWRSANGDAAEVQKVIDDFENIIDLAPSIDSGFIVLAHDSFPAYVQMAINNTLPYALNFTPDLTLQPIGDCVGHTRRQSYAETTDPSNSTIPQNATVAGRTATTTPRSSTGTGSATSTKVGLPTHNTESKSQVIGPGVASIAALLLALLFWF